MLKAARIRSGSRKKPAAINPVTSAATSRTRYSSQERKIEGPQGDQVRRNINQYRADIKQLIKPDKYCQDYSTHEAGQATDYQSVQRLF